MVIMVLIITRDESGQRAWPEHLGALYYLQNHVPNST